MLFGPRPDLSRLRVFGWCCWHTTGVYLKKLDTRATEAIMIDYTSGSWGSKKWDQAAQGIIVWRNAHFQKSECWFLLQKDISEIEYSLDGSEDNIVHHKGGQKEHVPEQDNVCSGVQDAVHVEHTPESSTKIY